MKTSTSALHRYKGAVKRAFVWLSRINRCRGFGIQSPTDYRFVCDIVNDKRHYDEYAVLLQRHATDDAATPRLLRLYFRIARHYEPRLYADFSFSPNKSIDYVLAGCANTEVMTLQGHSESDLLAAIKACDSGTAIVRMSAKTASQTTVSCILDSCESRHILIIEDIKDSKQARKLWQSVIDDARAIITFDLYCCGIVRFDSSRYKQNYIINF